MEFGHTARLCPYGVVVILRRAVLVEGLERGWEGRSSRPCRRLYRVLLQKEAEIGRRACGIERVFIIASWEVLVE